MADNGDEIFIQTMSLRTEIQEAIATALKKRCQGDIRTRGCEKCRKALGHMRIHHYGKST
eukprot:6792620-Prorocentrum_lima.AAC.1